MTRARSSGLERAGILAARRAAWRVVAVQAASRAQMLFGLAAHLLARARSSASGAACACRPSSGRSRIYAALTLAERRVLARSRARASSDSKQLVLFLWCRSSCASRAAIARRTVARRRSSPLGAAGALVGVVQFSAARATTASSNRPTGIARPLHDVLRRADAGRRAPRSRDCSSTREQRIWPAVAVPALLVALAADADAQRLGRRRGGASARCCLLRDLRCCCSCSSLAIAVAMAAAPACRDARPVDLRSATTRSNRDRLRCCRWAGEIVRDHPLFGVGPEMISRVYRQYRPAERGATLQPAPAQRAGADRRRARAAGAGRLALVRRRRPSSACCGSCDADPRRSLAAAGLGGDRRDARRRTVRVQLRRLRVPDAVPRPDHAALRRAHRGPEACRDGWPPLRRLGRRADARRSARSRQLAGAAASRSSATSCSITSSSAASIAFRPRRRCRSCASSATSTGWAAPPTSRTTSRALGGVPRSSASSATTTRRPNCAQSLQRGRHQRPRPRRRRRPADDAQDCAS